jgi:hypothetical protein
MLGTVTIKAGEHGKMCTGGIGSGSIANQCTVWCIARKDTFMPWMEQVFLGENTPGHSQFHSLSGSWLVLINVLQWSVHCTWSTDSTHIADLYRTYYDWCMWSLSSTTVQGACWDIASIASLANSRALLLTGLWLITGAAWMLLSLGCIYSSLLKAYEIMGASQTWVMYRSSYKTTHHEKH